MMMANEKACANDPIHQDEGFLRPDGSVHMRKNTNLNLVRDRNDFNALTAKTGGVARGSCHRLALPLSISEGSKISETIPRSGNAGCSRV